MFRVSDAEHSPSLTSVIAFALFATLLFFRLVIASSLNNGRVVIGAHIHIITIEYFTPAS